MCIRDSVIGTTVFFEAGVVVLIPLAFSVAKQTKKSTLYYAIPLLAGLASGYAFVPPSAGSVLVADSLGVNLGVMIMVGVPTALICMVAAGVIWGRFIGDKVFTKLPVNVQEIKEDSKELPPFGLVLGVILIPLVLILISTISKYLPIPANIQNVLSFIGKPFLALTIATLAAMYFLGIRRGYTCLLYTSCLCQVIQAFTAVQRSLQRHLLESMNTALWQVYLL